MSFPNQTYFSKKYKHKTLPLFASNEFDFYRCLEFNEAFYGMTVSKLHAGNLRPNTPENRYSKLFPNQKTSYWSDSVATAKAEVKRHGANSNLLIFHSYDDASSSFPTIKNLEPLIIIDGRDIGFNKILNKIENNIELTGEEQALVFDISEQNPDCLAYESVARKDGVNFLFFEKGFNKLSLKEVQLKLYALKGKNRNRILCAISCDYTPLPESYGQYFLPIAKLGNDKHYIESKEYLDRYKVANENMEEFIQPFKETANEILKNKL